MQPEDSIRWPSGPRNPFLASGEVHIWCAHAALPAEIRANLYELLSPAEQRKAGEFVFEKDRNTSIAARGILRTLLGSYLNQAPADLRFDFMGNDKPILQANESIHFNVSHSGDKVLLGFTRIRDIGVDIELRRELGDAVQIAENYFSPSEKIALRAVPDHLKMRAFFDCWSRKEAFIKTYGEGLSRELDGFDVSLTPGEPARLLSIDGSADRAADWTLEDLDPVADYSAAFCIQGRPDRIETYQWP